MKIGEQALRVFVNGVKSWTIFGNIPGPGSQSFHQGPAHIRHRLDGPAWISGKWHSATLSKWYRQGKYKGGAEGYDQVIR